VHHGLVQIFPKTQQLPWFHRREPIGFVYLHPLTCRHRVAKQVSLVNQDLLVLAKTKTSISINNDTAPKLHVSAS
jgi:hypothetical protein